MKLKKFSLIKIMIRRNIKEVIFHLTAAALNLSHNLRNNKKKQKIF